MYCFDVPIHIATMRATRIIYMNKQEKLRNFIKGQSAVLLALPEPLGQVLMMAGMAVRLLD
jgi:hypothetical protein